MQADAPTRATGAFTGRQRRFLKGLAQRLEPVVWVGEGGIGEGVLRALEEALRSHELVKVRMQRPADKRAMAAELAASSRAELVGLVGHTVILYRANPDSPRIELPR
jgi:RNA-binding protein